MGSASSADECLTKCEKDSTCHHVTIFRWDTSTSVHCWFTTFTKKLTNTLTPITRPLHLAKGSGWSHCYAKLPYHSTTTTQAPTPAPTTAPPTTAPSPTPPGVAGQLKDLKNQISSST